MVVWRRLAAICFGLALAVAGCGSDESSPEASDNAGVELAKWLPPDQVSYDAVDLDGVREAEGLAADADIITPIEGGEPPPPLAQYAAGVVLRPFAEDLIDTEVVEALELGSASAAASFSGDGNLVAIATDADPETVRSNLEGLGFSDENGVLVGKSTAFKVEDGLILGAADAGTLDALADEPADQAPEPLLERADGVYVNAILNPGNACLQAQATALDGDGEGELLYRVSEEPDPGKLNIEDTDEVTFGEPEVDGDTITVAATGEPDATAIPDAVSSRFFTYEC